MAAWQRPMVLWVAIDPLHSARQVGIAAPLQLGVVDVGLGTVALHDTYMGEVVSKTQENHINRDMKVGWASHLRGQGWARRRAFGGMGEGSVAPWLWGHERTCYSDRFRTMTPILRQKRHKYDHDVRNNGEKAGYW